jgi:hypothetical protein
MKIPISEPENVAGVQLDDHPSSTNVPTAASPTRTDSAACEARRPPGHVTQGSWIEGEGQVKIVV